MDDVIHVLCIQRQVMTHSNVLLTLTKEIFHMVSRKAISMWVRYVPSWENDWVDALSRFKGMLVEWHLHPQVFKSLILLWMPESGSVCLMECDTATALSVVQPEDTDRRPRHIHGGLKPMGAHLPVSPTSGSCPPEGDTPLVVLHLLGTPDHARLAGSAMVRGDNTVVLTFPPARVGLPGQ